MESLEGLVAAYLATTRTTKQQLCNDIGIKSTKTLNSKLRGESEMSLNEAIALSRMLNITIDHVAELCRFAAPAST